MQTFDQSLSIFPRHDALNIVGRLEQLTPTALSPSLCVRPLFGQRVPAGFPSPAEEYVEKGLDLNSYLVRNKVATYFFRVQGDSMVGALATLGIAHMWECNTAIANLSSYVELGWRKRCQKNNDQTSLNTYPVQNFSTNSLIFC